MLCCLAELEELGVGWGVQCTVYSTVEPVSALRFPYKKTEA